MSNPVLGKAGVLNAELDLDKLIGSHACIVANSGGGKSGLLRVLLEQTHGQIQHIIFDTEDEFYTLREHFDYVIAGGEDGDLPISVDAAAALAVTTLENGFSLVIQLNDLRDRAEYISAFLLALLDAPRRLQHPVLIVVDEVQRFAPQEGTAASSIGILELLARGRKRGFTAVLAGNRTALISKSVLGNINNWLLGRVGQDTDRAVVAKMLGFRPSSPESVALLGLEARKFWRFGPALSPTPELFRVADARTTIVRSGQAKIPTPPAPAKLRKILAALAQAAAAKVEPSAPAANVPMSPEADASSAARIAELTAELVECRRSSSQALNDVGASFTTVEDAVHEFKQSLLVITQAWGDTNQAWLESPASGATRAQAVPMKSARPAASPAGAAAGKMSPRDRILAAIAELEAIGVSPAPRMQVAFLSKYKHDGVPNFRNAMGALRTEGKVIYPTTESVQFTDAGRKVAPQPPKILRSEDLHQRIIELLDGVEGRILPHLISVYPKEIGRDRLAQLSGYAHAGVPNFRNSLGRLRTLGFVDYPTTSTAIAKSTLFIDGR